MAFLFRVVGIEVRMNSLERSGIPELRTESRLRTIYLYIHMYIYIIPWSQSTTIRKPDPFGIPLWL